jgi:hypothetical protein
LVLKSKVEATAIERKNQRIVGIEVGFEVQTPIESEILTKVGTKSQI